MAFRGTRIELGLSSMGIAYLAAVLSGSVTAAGPGVGGGPPSLAYKGLESR